jgi:hypothetical protein
MQHNIAQADALVNSYVSPFDAVKRRLSLLAYCQATGIKLEQSGRFYIGKCPLPDHKDDNPSFSLDPDSNRCWCNSKCYDRLGGDKGEDVIQLHALRTNQTPKQAAEELLKWIKGDGVLSSFRQCPHYADVATPKRKESIPSAYWDWRRELRSIPNDFARKLAEQRGLSIEAVLLARKRGLLWLLIAKTKSGKKWAWVVTDAQRKTGVWRRLDGELWDDEQKAHFLPGSRNVAIGISHVDTKRLVVVEGMPDMLTAFEFVSRGVIVMPTATAIFTPKQLTKLCRQQRRIRIFQHSDEAGIKAAEKWGAQLQEAGNIVDIYEMPEGIGDLNDLARSPQDKTEWNNLTRVKR